MSKKILFLTSLVCLLVGGVGFAVWHEANRPKRIWVRAFEKDDFEGGTQLPAEDDTLSTEEGILVSMDAGVCVVTHNKTRADYLVTISVTRHGGDANRFGDAELSVERANGDVVVSETFSQYAHHSNGRVDDDIAQQPLKALVNLLCKKDVK